MQVRSTGIGYLAGVVVLLLLASIPFAISWKKHRDAEAIYHEVIGKLHHGWRADKGHWVGDVAQLYRMGEILREVGEADTAPLQPLVPQPIPFHGYYIRTVDGGQPVDNDEGPHSFKGETWSKDTFGFCVYPAESGPEQSIWLVGRLGLYRKLSPTNTPILKWPTRSEMNRDGWGIVD